MGNLNTIEEWLEYEQNDPETHRTLTGYFYMGHLSVYEEWRTVYQDDDLDNDGADKISDGADLILMADGVKCSGGETNCRAVHPGDQSPTASGPGKGTHLLRNGGSVEFRVPSRMKNRRPGVGGGQSGTQYWW